MKRLTEKRDGKNVIALRQDGKVKWALCSSGKGDAPTQYLYGEHADRLAECENQITQLCEAYAEKSLELVRLQKAYDKMARYLEQVTSSCPTNFDCDFKKEKCRTCLQECLCILNKDYNKELAVKCWKEAFIESEGKDAGCI